MTAARWKCSAFAKSAKVGHPPLSNNEYPGHVARLVLGEPSVFVGMMNQRLVVFSQLLFVDDCPK
jgi:hypothetical protein